MRTEREFWRHLGAALLRREPKEEQETMAVGERCPACGHMPGQVVEVSQAELNWEGQLTMWAVELTRAAIVPGMEPQEIGQRLRAIHAALQGLYDGPASDPPAA